jgi:hypothetical protein
MSSAGGAGFARCTLQAAVPNDAPQTAIADLNGLR